MGEEDLKDSGLEISVPFSRICVKGDNLGGFVDFQKKKLAICSQKHGRCWPHSVRRKTVHPKELRALVQRPSLSLP